MMSTTSRLVVCLAGILAASAASGPAQLRLPPDLIFDRAVGADGAVTFRHSTHVGFAAMRCDGCHPAPFKILHPERQTTHEAMNAGQSCGTCHDGRRAFATTGDDLCARCHTAWEKPQDDYPPPALYAGSADSPGRVTFRHSTHRGSSIDCGVCHLPRVLPGGAGAAAPPAPSLHDTCGTCHDGTRAFALMDDAACSKCHATKEAAR